MNEFSFSPLGFRFRSFQAKYVMRSSSLIVHVIKKIQFRFTTNKAFQALRKRRRKTWQSREASSHYFRPDCYVSMVAASSPQVLKNIGLETPIQSTKGGRAWRSWS